ncbi:hypothetical protein CWI38_0210p0040 [Hamiltosporidium tvaerminnensis]|uniref:Uncharacterized protein n=2 Tax=Hamiltosporidium TaxID=1176354 RepID=A0A4Q9LET1_9MICR|nr:hypothetical protein LUQ84_3506 [Hamiltosporidium tvaerminnensis]TBU04406.1 hypothetical protein CWI37_0139p0020 [Hamiltosporidium tvaerminnensis]TBU05601.1 hypothetical protein CWI39_0657p0030 [Hamiltosporidium magnivora]TBU07011.1 hypothetical protein CWI36_0342p0040 [Hamiltosporidium magnivora]TBU19486.1 hypothetical protein CWI38_0210p0040 [Hamiltosporidium tvaerminnensis]
MAVLLEEEEQAYESVCASDVKSGNIIMLDSANKIEYYKVSDISKVKTGKHGAAKVILEGQILGSGKNITKQFNGGIKLNKVELKKKSYVLVDVDEDNDSLCVQANTTGGNEDIEYLQLNRIQESDLSKIKEYFLANEGEVVFTAVTAKDYLAIEDLKISKVIKK